MQHFLSKNRSSPKWTDERSQLCRILVHPLIQITYNNMHSKTSYFSFSISKHYELMQSRSASRPLRCLPINSRSAPEVFRAAPLRHGITKQWSSHATRFSIKNKIFLWLKLWFWVQASSSSINIDAKLMKLPSEIALFDLHSPGIT